MIPCRPFRPLLALALVLSMITPAASHADPNDNWWDGFAAPPNGKGMNSQIAALAVHDGKLIAGGHFTQAGNRSAQRVASFNGTGWQQLGSGMNDWVNALYSMGTELYAGGSFSTAGGAPAAGIARWDGQWHPVGSGIAGKGVYALGTYQGDLIAAGHFDETDGSPGNLIARWDGDEWSPLGAGLSGGAVLAVQEFAGDLYAAGTFTHAGGSPAANFARWNGTAWDDAGATFTGGQAWWVWPVEALSTEYNGNLIVGGDFSHINGVSMNGLAEWDGAVWTPLGTELAAGVGIQSIAVYHGDLVVFGFFDGPGGSSRIARWNGTEWAGFGSGCTNHYLFGDGGAMTVYEGEVYVGGDIGEAGGQPSDYIARWSDGPPTGALANAPASGVTLAAPFPNPIRGTGTIAYSLDRDLAIDLSVYDAAGRLVADLVRGIRPAGQHTHSWDGRGRAGRPVAAGLYFVRLTSEAGTSTEKLVIQR